MGIKERKCSRQRNKSSIDLSKFTSTFHEKFKDRQNITTPLLRNINSSYFIKLQTPVLHSHHSGSVMTKGRESENKFSSNTLFSKQAKYKPYLNISHKFIIKNIISEVENKSESSSEAESISITKLRNESLHKVDCLTPQNRNMRCNQEPNLSFHIIPECIEDRNLIQTNRTLALSSNANSSSHFPENKPKKEEVIYKPLKYLMDTYVLNKDAKLNK